jgi:hypothetical protein
MTPSTWHRASAALTPYRALCLIAAGVAIVGLALAVVGVTAGVIGRSFFAVLGVCAFVMIETWGLALVTWWFGDREEQRFRTLPAGWRRSARTLSRWSLSSFLVLGFVVGLVFLLVPLLR